MDGTARMILSIHSQPKARLHKLYFKATMHSHGVMMDLNIQVIIMDIHMVLRDATLLHSK